MNKKTYKILIIYHSKNNTFFIYDNSTKNYVSFVGKLFKQIFSI